MSLIRNPFDVLVSWYHYSKGGKRSGTAFGRWLCDIIVTGNGYLEYATNKGAEFATVFLRYELGLESQVRELLSRQHIDVPDRLTFPHMGKSEGRSPYVRYYQPLLRDTVEIKYGWELKRFGYSFEGN